MKILRIRFKNIHSFRGEHELCLDAPPLSTAGLFAITGPTGAGKSTLLDVITLALYNNIPRFEGKISKTDIEKFGSILTHHTYDAYAEVDYEAEGRQYRSKWSVSSTAKDQKLKDYHMELATLPDGKIEDLKKTEVPLKNEALIGLNYEQFVRSILLSQGEFARFLKSKEDERAALLEHITGADIYRKIGRAAFQKAKEAKTAIDIAKREISEFKFLDEETVEQLNQRIISESEQSVRLQTEISVLQTKLTNIRELKKQQTLLSGLMQEYQLFTQKKESFKIQEIKLERHRSMLPFKGDLLSHKDLVLQLENTDKAIAETENMLQECQIKCDAIKQRVTQFTGKHIPDDEIQHELHEFSTRIVQMTASLQQLSDNGKKVREKLNNTITELRPEFSLELQKITKPELQLYYIQEKLALLNKEPEIQSKSTENELSERLESSKAKTDLLKEQSEIMEKTAKLNVLNKEQSEKINELTLQHKALEKTISHLTRESQRMQDRIIELRKSKEHHLMLHDMESYRSALKEGEPCPLCGSKEHPYAVHGVISDYIKLQMELDEMEKQKQKSDTELQQACTKNAEIKGIISTLKENIEKNNYEIHQLSHNILPEFRSFDLKQILQLFEKQKQSTQKIQDSLINVQNYKKLTETEVLLCEIKEIIEQYRVKEKEVKELYIGTDVVADSRKLAAEWDSELKKSLSLTANLQLKKQDKNLLEDAVAKLTHQLSVSLEKAGYPSIQEAYTFLLDDREWQKLSDEKSQLEKEDERLLTTIRSVEQKIQESQIGDTDQNDENTLADTLNRFTVERDQLLQSIGSIRNQLEENAMNVKRLQEKKDKLFNLEKESEKWILLDQCIGDSEGKKFSKFAQQISLQYLLRIANRRLAELSDRYILATDTGQSEFLEVIDSYLGNTRRSVRTLSGGETFIVSLALALSLSDMASKNVKLESLFIDEGFGTLDPETLESALITLEKLQSDSRKTIGIISHVESLKERIYTQVKVVRNNRGHSKIEVVG